MGTRRERVRFRFTAVVSSGEGGCMPCVCLQRSVSPRNSLMSLYGSVDILREGMVVARKLCVTAARHISWKRSP